MGLSISTQDRDDSSKKTIFINVSSANQFVRFHKNNRLAITTLACAMT